LVWATAINASVHRTFVRFFQVICQKITGTLQAGYVWGPNVTSMATRKVSEKSVSVYLRMPRSARNTLDEMSRHLEMKPSTVTNALFRFVTQPAWFHGWSEHVETLRAIVERDGGKKLCLHDFSFDEWQERRRTYDWLERMGLIEEFEWRRSYNHSSRVICSFKVSDAGRVVALIFKEVGISDPIDQDEFDEAAGVQAEADGMAS
jgi:hypothetical protein